MLRAYLVKTYFIHDIYSFEQYDKDNYLFSQIRYHIR